MAASRPSAAKFAAPKRVRGQPRRSRANLTPAGRLDRITDALRLLGRALAGIAQLVEHCTENAGVLSSSLSLGTQTSVYRGFLLCISCKPRKIQFSVLYLSDNLHSMKGYCL